jgi:hypothetical protein
MYGTDSKQLNMILGRVIKMLIITYIMGHTLTITEDSLPFVLDQVRHKSTKPLEPHTSPRLANRQLKFYFAMLRDTVYHQVLNGLQQTYKNSGPKQDRPLYENIKQRSWLPSLCAMLGLSMVLEEVQRTIYIQAEAKIHKQEMTTQQATIEAENACGRIDEKHDFLVRLFCSKYKEKLWAQGGSFGPGTPKYGDGSIENEFLRNIHTLLRRNREFWATLWMLLLAHG